MVLVYHGVPWYWCSMLHHGMVYHGIAWYTMVYHGIPWYAVAEWYSAGLAIARSWVRTIPMAAVYRRQLSNQHVILRGQLISSLRATG